MSINYIQKRFVQLYHYFYNIYYFLSNNKKEIKIIVKIVYNNIEETSKNTHFYQVKLMIGLDIL